MNSRAFHTPLFLFALTASSLAKTQVFQTFEGDGFDGWQETGTAFGLAPIAGKTDAMPKPFIGYANDSLAASTYGGDSALGSLTSPAFVIREPYVNFLIAGGDSAGKTAVQLIIGGKVVRETVGKRSLRCERVTWNLNEFAGQTANIRMVDEATGPWGFIAADYFVFTDNPNEKTPLTTRNGEEFYEGLTPATTDSKVSIPLDSALKIEAEQATHQLASPTAITFDDHGRVYVAETHRYRYGVEDDRERLYWYLDDLASATTADRLAMLKKWSSKISHAELTAKSEIIRRLADTDGDGTLDESKVFADGFNQPLDGTGAGVFFHEGNLYFSCIPKVLSLQDTDGDGTADQRKVIEEGFGVRVSISGHDMNGFALGPDGKIYGTIGDRGFNITSKEGVKYDYRNQGALFRFEPDGTGFEVVHTGLRNPKEIAFDALGNAFTVDNNSDQGDNARVVYLVEGGDSGWQMEHQTMHSFHRQIGLEERPPNRWMDEKMWELENPEQPAFMLPPCAHLGSGPSGLTYHPGAGFLESEAGHFHVCDYRGTASLSGVWSFQMTPKGAAMEMKDAHRLVWGVAATDVEYSWDGKLYISDFVTGWRSHEEGRLLSVSTPPEKSYRAAEAATVPLFIKEGFAKRPSSELFTLLGHSDARIRLRAQLALTLMPDAFPQLTAASRSGNFLTRIHGIWGLGILARREILSAASAEKFLIQLLTDPDPEIRAQALRALGFSEKNRSAIPLAPLLADASPRVRFFAAILVGKRNLTDQLDAVCQMLAENNNRDAYLRHAGAYALQHASSPTSLAALSQHPSAAVRLAATVALRRSSSPEISAFLLDTDSKVADEAIRAICDNDLRSEREKVATLLDAPSRREWSPFMLRRLIHNAYRIGTPENAARILKVATATQTPEIVRTEATRLLSSWTEPFPADQFTGVWRPLGPRDLATLRPILTAALPSLLAGDGPLLTAALDWIRRYQLAAPSLDEATLRRLILKPALPPAARATALNLLLKNPPQTLASFLTEISTDPADEVALTALAALAKISPEAALPLLLNATESTQIPRAQKAWPVLATLPGPAADALFLQKLTELRATHGISPTAIELAAAAKQRSAPSIATALAALETSLTTSTDPLAQWNAALEGGDATAGAALFTSHPSGQCMRCHRAEPGHAAGGEAAPNLHGIATRQKDRRYLLESLVLPSTSVVPGFGTATTPPISPMPPMGLLLQPTELRDLVAWMATLKKSSK